MLSRLWLRSWKSKRGHFIVVCQAHLRRRITCRKWAETKELEYRSSRCIQGMIRMFLAKCELATMRRIHSANVIASRFHSYRARKFYIQMRKSMYAARIQSLFRVHLTKRRYIEARRQKIGAAKEIQKYWRGYLSRKLFSSLLRDRYIRSCQHQLQMFGSDIDYYKNLHSYAPINNQFGTLNEIEDGDYKIQENEQKLEELQILLAQLTPQSVRQGWKEQLEKDASIERAMLTKKKINAIFEVYRRVKSEEIQTERKVRERENLAEIQGALQQWKSDFEKSLQNENKQLQLLEAQCTLRQAIADEKRKWVVQHTVGSGKPFKGSARIQNYKDDDSREQRFTRLLKMQIYFTQLSQLEDAVKPLNKFCQAR